MSCVLAWALFPGPAAAAGGDPPGLETALREVRRHGEVSVVVTHAPPARVATAPGVPLSLPRFRAACRTVRRRILQRAAPQAEMRYAFGTSPAILVRVRSEAALRAIAAAPEVRSVAPDQRGRGALLESVPAVHAPEVHAMGFRGSGRVVAVLDTGVALDHPDIEGKVIGGKRFLYEGFTIDEEVADGHGHGTHVASIVVAGGEVVGPGVAPGASLIAVKVLDDENQGWISDWTRGLEYVIELHEDPENGIRVDAVNMSLVSAEEYRDICDGANELFSDACERARAAGITLLAASGNDGSVSRMPLPACFSTTVAVGSVRDDAPDAISSFTSRNEHLDLLAPGQGVIAAGIDGGEQLINGTSQAAPHVSGAVALLREIEPNLEPEQIRSILVGTGVPVLDPILGRFWPRLDVRTAALAAGGTEPLAIFLRGDCNGDDTVDIADPIRALEALFVAPEPAPPCLAACDANRDGSVDISDPVWLLDFLFRGSSAPLGPFPECGPAVETEELTCRSSPCAS